MRRELHRQSDRRGAPVAHPARHLSASLHAELSQQIMYVGLGGSDPDVETTGDVLVAQPCRQQFDDLHLAGRQRKSGTRAVPVTARIRGLGWLWQQARRNTR